MPRKRANLTPAERSTRATLASHASWANTENPTARTEPGRQAFLDKLADQFDPQRKLPPEQRRRRAESARKAHMARMSLIASQKRRAARGEVGGGNSAPAA